MEIIKTGKYIIKSKSLDDNYKIIVNYIISNKLSITFLEPTTFCGIGYTKWYFKTHFYSAFEVIEEIS